MKQPYFVVVLAHSLHGRLRRIHIPQKALYAILMLAVLGCFTLVGVASSYARMVWKVADYNSLRKEAEVVRAQYNDLQKDFKQTKLELAKLELLSSEISSAYGIKRRLEGPANIADEGNLVPTYAESLAQYDFLRTASISKFNRDYLRSWQTQALPDLWPVVGRLSGPFGKRMDPFSGESAYHTGIDISAPVGSPVQATADGIVVFAAWSGGYGRLVVVDHGGGMQTYYGHLSRIDVISGQGVRKGQNIGALGRSGRVTAPHLHYEVRRNRIPQNPYHSLSRATFAKSTAKDLPF